MDNILHNLIFMKQINIKVGLSSSKKTVLFAWLKAL